MSDSENIYIAYIVLALIIIIGKIVFLVWYCTAVKRRRREREARARVTSQSFQPGNLQHTYVIPPPGGNPNSQQGFNSANYWNPAMDGTHPDSAMAPPPSYSSAVASPYPVQKY